MPTNRTRRARKQRSSVPQWLTHYLETGQEPPEDHPERAQFDAWFFIPGWTALHGHDWPDPPPPALPDWWTEEQKAAERARRSGRL